MRTEPRIRYEDDLYGWAQAQAAAVRDGRWADIDVEHLAEEIEDVAGSVKRELRSRLEVLLLHLLKQQYQPERETRSWSLTIAEQAGRVAELLVESPSLKPMLGKSVAIAYGHARYRAAIETGLDLDTFPEAMNAIIERELEQHLNRG
jgi:hypothetical protein